MATAPALSTGRPGLPVLAAFAGIVLFGGGNFVAAHFSNQELPPVFGAGFRFAVASVLFMAFVAVRRIALPAGTALLGIGLFGLLLGSANALSFWALLRLPVGVAALFMAAVPLLTLFLARLHRLERLSWRGMAGGVVAVIGIGVLRGFPMGAELPGVALLAMLGAAACAAEAGVVIKRFPPSPPAVTNGLAMAVGTVVLLGTSALTGEAWAIPREAATWVALGHLIVLGSVGLFGLYLFVLQRWTASGTSYSVVLTPVVASALGAWLAGQPVGLGLVVGGLVVLAGVYVGALSRPRAPAPAAPEDEALVQSRTTC